MILLFLPEISLTNSNYNPNVSKVSTRRRHVLHNLTLIKDNNPDAVFS